MSPDGLELLDREGSTAIVDDWLGELDALILFDEASKGKDHVEDGYFVVDVEEDIDILLDFEDDVPQQVLAEQD